MSTFAEYIEVLNQRSPTILFASIDAAIKATVVLALAWIVTRGMRRASASARHWIWMTAGASLVIIPVLAMSLPAWRVLPRWTTIEPPAERQPLISAAPLTPGIAPMRSAPALHVDAQGTVTTVPPQKRLAELSVAAWAIVIWATGFAIALLPLPIGALALRCLRRNSKPLRGAAWDDARDQAARALSVHRHVELLVTARRAMPMTWGIFRPKVLLPEESDEWSAQRRSAVLLHELAHVRRMDCLWQPVFHFICAAYWFHPLSWVARANAQNERERSCDDLVLTCGTKETEYAEQLLHVASKLRITRLTGAAAIAMARPSQLEDRLLAILDAKRNRKALTWIGATLVVLVLSAVIVPIALLRAQASPSGTKNPLREDGGLSERLPGDGPDEVADLSGQELRPEDISGLAAMPRLKRLELGASSVSDNDLATLSELRNVEWLDVSKNFKEQHQKPSVTDNGLKSLSNWKRLRTLKLHGQPITDEGLKNLKALPNLRRLQLGATNVTGTGFEALPNIEWIRLDATPVSDDGLQVMGTLKNLKQLYLYLTNVTDAGLVHLEGLKNLQVLNVHGTKVTAAGLAKFQRALPNVAIGSDLKDFVDGAATRSTATDTSREPEVTELRGVRLKQPIQPLNLFGMKLASLTPELQEIYGIAKSKGVLILDPGPNIERLDIGDPREGCYIWMVGNRRVANVNELVRNLKRIAQVPPPTTGWVGPEEGWRDAVRIVYSYHPESRGTNTQYLRLTADDREELFAAAAPAPSITLVTDGNLFLERWLNQLMPEGSRIVTPAEYEALPDAGDAVIFDRYVPKKMPAAATMYFGAVPSDGLIRAVASGPVK
ncbi:MAG: hypothetical protein H0T11_05535, partial [Chthoniobacterales bacterium]|nr:hypothetical protein [Chthoniobacterales bacterium]